MGFPKTACGGVTWSWAEVTPYPVINIYSLLAALSNINRGRKDGWPSVPDHFFSLFPSHWAQSKPTSGPEVAQRHRARDCSSVPAGESFTEGSVVADAVY